MAECLYVADTALSKQTPRYIEVTEVAVPTTRELHLTTDT
jgi:hypothetical protein